MFRRPPYRGLQRQVPYESEASSRCAVAAAHGRSLGRVLLYVLRQVRRVSLVQHTMSMSAKLLAGVAVLLLSAAEHAAERAAHAAVLITNTENW
jgi:hypothetical protein